jgi:hypothetical protein
MVTEKGISIARLTAKQQLAKVREQLDEKMKHPDNFSGIIQDLQKEVETWEARLFVYELSASIPLYICNRAFNDHEVAKSRRTNWFFVKKTIFDENGKKYKKKVLVESNLKSIAEE